MTHSPRDLEAWKLAIELMRKSNEPVWVNNVDRILASEGPEAAGKFAAHGMQFRALRSAPWLTLPCDLHHYNLDEILAAGDDERGEYSAAVLLKRMRRAGVSDWHPDPVAALRKVEKKPAA